MQCCLKHESQVPSDSTGSLRDAGCGVGCTRPNPDHRLLPCDLGYKVGQPWEAPSPTRVPTMWVPSTGAPLLKSSFLPKAGGGQLWRRLEPCSCSLLSLHLHTRHWARDREKDITDKSEIRASVG